MTTQTMINDLNVSLVNEQPDITIVNYVKLLNKNIFNIDIGFIDDLLNLLAKMVLVSPTKCYLNNKFFLRQVQLMY